MAEINTSTPVFYNAGASGASAIIGYESGHNRVARFSFTTDASGATSVSIGAIKVYPGSGSSVSNSVGFYITTDANGYANAGAGSTKHGDITWTLDSGVYYGSAQNASVVLLPNTTYYLWLFPTTTTYGYCASYQTAATVTTYGTSVHTVTFNANGGSGAPEPQTKVYGSILTLSSTVPTWTGYTFLNWNTKSDNTGAGYAAGGQYGADEDVTLYAIWQRNSYTNTIRHYRRNAANTDWEGSDDSTFTASYGATVTVPAGQVKSYSGMHNTGVARSNWGGTTESNKTIGSDTFVQPAGGVFIAYYYYYDTYTVSYDANGGTGAPDAQAKTHSIDLTLSSTVPSRASTTRSGYTVTFSLNGGSGTAPAALTSTITTVYTFAGWSTTKGGAAAYAAGATYTADESVTLYAVWTASDVNGAVTLPTAAREGYTLLGWATSAAATAAQYEAGGSFTPAANVTLYAVWKPDGLAQIMTASGEKSYEAFVYHGGTWHKVIPHVMTASGWNPET